MIPIFFWLAFLAFIPITMAVFFIKNRSSVASWIRAVKHTDRWLLHTTLPKESNTKEINATLQKVVSQARNLEWDASCTYKRRNHETGEWTIGLISNTRPINTETPPPFQLSHLPASQTIRVSGHPRDEHDTVKSLLQQWAEKKNLQYSPIATSLSAQSFQCWEWDIVDSPTDALPSWSWLNKAAERIFEMRDILLYPTLFTLISIIMCGTGSPWLFGIGIFLVILMSGACKFVFLHQREDATQESHLQNY